MKFLISPEDCRKSGIYLIGNTVDKRVYVGACHCFLERYRRHQRQLPGQKHHSTWLQTFVNESGINTLTFELIELAEKTELKTREQYYLNFYQAGNQQVSFNRLKEVSRMTGFKFSEESRRKMSLARKGKKLSPEHIRNRTLARKGKKSSDKQKQVASQTHRGKVVSAETRAKLSAANKGRKLSDEHKQKLLAANVGRPISEQQKAQISQVHKGKTLSEETRRKISQAVRRHYATLHSAGRLAHELEQQRSETRKKSVL